MNCSIINIFNIYKKKNEAVNLCRQLLTRKGHNRDCDLISSGKITDVKCNCDFVLYEKKIKELSE